MRLTQIKELILDALFPPLCLNCRKYLKAGDSFEEGKIICRDCFSSIKTNHSFFCPICKSRIPEFGKTCHKNSPYILGAASNYDDEIVKNLIRMLKYEYLKDAGEVLSEIMIAYIKEVLNGENIKDFVVSPVPLFFLKERVRGFNQSQILAEKISGYFEVPIIKTLKRIKDTKSQAGLKDIKERTENVKNCFVAEKPEILANKNIVLIDDVFTSGATMNEAVKTLKQGGAKKIIAFVTAKA